MEHIGEHIKNHLSQLPQEPDADEAKYTLVMHGLCKQYGVVEPVGRHVFSIIENMSRHGRICLYTHETLAKYSGGNEQEIEAVLRILAGKEVIVSSKLKQTKGWKLSDEVRRQADRIKGKIDRFGKDPKKHN